MRSFLTFGLISLSVAAALSACGDDDGGGGTGGTAGSAGTGGGAGTAGSAGTGGSSGAGGSAGSAGTGGTGGIQTPDANCTGCVQLTVPIPATPTNAANMLSQAGFMFVAAATDAPFDLTDVTTITWRIQVLTPNANYFVQPFLQNAPPEDPTYSFGAYPPSIALTAAAFPANQWVDVPVDISILAGGGSGVDAGADGGTTNADAGDAGDAGPVLLTSFDKSKIRQLGLNVGALAAAGAGLVSIEIDSVTVTGTSNFTSKTFTAGTEGLVLNMFEVPPGTGAPTFH